MNNSEPSTQNSYDDDEEKPAAIERLEMFLNKRYNFRYNTVTGKLEYKKVRNQMYKPITDFVENSILREVLKAKVKCSIQGLRYLLMSDYVEQFDPFKDYFFYVASDISRGRLHHRISQYHHHNEPRVMDRMFQKMVCCNGSLCNE